MLISKLFALPLLLACFCAPLSSADSPITVCYEGWTPFYQESEAGHATGPIIEILQHIAGKKGRGIVFTATAYKRCLQGVQTGQFDLMLLVSSGTTDVISSKFALAHWTITAFVSKKSKTKTFWSVAQFKAQRIGMFAGYNYPHHITQYREQWGLELLIPHSGPIDDQTGRIFRLLEIDRIDVALVDQVWAKHIGAERKFKVRALQPAVYSERSVIGFSTMAQDVAQLVENELAVIAANGELDGFYNRSGVAPPMYLVPSN